MNTHSSLQNLSRVRIFTAFISLIFSLQTVYFDDLINRDGILYLQTAELFMSEGLYATQGLLNWPFFSILISWVHQLTSLSLETAGFVLNGLLFILLTDALVLISSLLVVTPRQLILAAILILGFAPINEFRDFIIRDPGYWAFTSLALYHFILFLNSPSYKAATLWQVFMTIAILFRVEGSLLLLGLPLYLLFIRKPIEGLKQVAQSSYFLVIGITLGITPLLNQPDLVATFGKIHSVFNYLDLSSYATTLSVQTSIMQDQVLNKYSEDYAAFILITGMLAMFMYKILKGFSISYLVIYFITASRNLQPHAKNTQHLLLYFLALNALLLLAFLFKEYFISVRYASMALIALLLLVMHNVTVGIERLWLAKNKLLLSVIALALFYNVADMSTTSSSKKYIKDTAIWAANHLPPNRLIMTDDQFMLYYFNREQPTSIVCVKNILQKTAFTIRYENNASLNKDFCAAEKANDYNSYDYILVVEKERHPKLISFLKTLNLKQIYYQENTHLNDGASVYKVIK